jgi:translation initiation factor IF-2
MPETDRNTRAGERRPMEARKSSPTTGGKRRVVIEGDRPKRQQNTSNAPPRSRRRRRGGGGGAKTVEEQFELAERKRQRRSGIETIAIPEGSSPKDLAEHLDRSVAEVIGALMNLGDLVTINQALDRDRLLLVAEALGLAIEVISPEQARLAAQTMPTGGSTRPPVVTIMGHVDHGKTSLLDAIRQTSVTAGESGGITQHIGAYQITHDQRAITFIDTPGHQAFTAMRARGAQVTDIVILVVAADDGVMPQTEEAITHARAAGVPIVVAVNKIDRPGADPTRVRTELAQRGLQPEEWGGQTIFVDVSAKQRLNLDELLEMILLVADVEELTAPAEGPATGVIIESQLDPGRGPVATVLVTSGQLEVGDAVVAGAHWARVRRMLDENGHAHPSAGPSMPVEVAGFNSVPEAGEHVSAMDERAARRQAEQYASQLRTAALSRRTQNRMSLAGFAARVAESTHKTLPVIIKADANGSVEAIEDELAKLPQDQVELDIIHRAVGGVTESDVALAAAAEAIIVGFNVRPVGRAEEVSRQDGIEIRTYSVIYRLVDDLRQAMTGLLEDDRVEVVTGQAEVIDTFQASKIGTIAGCAVRSGRLVRGGQARLIRSGTIIHTGEIVSLRRGKEDAREVSEGFECGVVFAQAQAVEIGDEIEALTIEAHQRSL